MTVPLPWSFEHNLNQTTFNHPPANVLKGGIQPPVGINFKLSVSVCDEVVSEWWLLLSSNFYIYWKWGRNVFHRQCSPMMFLYRFSHVNNISYLKNTSINFSPVGSSSTETTESFAVVEGKCWHSHFLFWWCTCEPSMGYSLMIPGFSMERENECNFANKSNESSQPVFVHPRVHRDARQERKE